MRREGQPGHSGSPAQLRDRGDLEGPQGRGGRRGSVGEAGVHVESEQVTQQLVPAGRDRRQRDLGCGIKVAFHWTEGTGTGQSPRAETAAQLE